jgi:hypothetical protein
MHVTGSREGREVRWERRKVPRQEARAAAAAAVRCRSSWWRRPSPDEIRSAATAPAAASDLPPGFGETTWLLGFSLGIAVGGLCTVENWSAEQAKQAGFGETRERAGLGRRSTAESIRELELHVVFFALGSIVYSITIIERIIITNDKLKDKITNVQMQRSNVQDAGVFATCRLII